MKAKSSLFRSTSGPASPRYQLREPLGRRATGIVLALVLEGLLLLALLTLGRNKLAREEPRTTVVQLSESRSEAAPAPEPRPQEEQQRPDAQLPQETSPPTPETPRPEPLPPAEAQPPVVPPPLIAISREDLAAADISKLPSAPAPARRRAVMGPPNTPSAGDTERVAGSGPNGEPLYAASWYREPYDSELRGYLSAARGPGWGLIACRTVADYRVEDCVGIDEEPNGSNIMRAALAAAWQFRVRPPRIGGRPQVGEWVRIRIDYEQRRR